MRKTLLFLASAMLLASIPVLGQPPYNCPAPPSECPGSCLETLFCDDFEVSSGYNYTTNKIASLDTHTILLARDSQWRTDSYEGMFASQPAGYPGAIASEAPATSHFNANCSVLLPESLQQNCATSCPPLAGQATGYRRSCSTTLKPFSLNTSSGNYYRITSVLRVRREAAAPRNSKVAWHLQQIWVVPNLGNSYSFHATLVSDQPNNRVCFWADYLKAVANQNPSDTLSPARCLPSASFDPANDFVRLVTVLDLTQAGGANPVINVQVEARDMTMSNGLLTGCTDTSVPPISMPCKSTFSAPISISIADRDQIIAANAAGLRIYPVVCNDTGLDRVVEIDRVSFVRTSAFTF